MNVRDAYDKWAGQYDIDENKTRDLEGVALLEMLKDYSFVNCLEIGCGTGKNTTRLLEISDTVTAVDFSKKMLDNAREKLSGKNVRFILADVTQDWTFADAKYDLITFSLVLEHIKDLQPILKKAADVSLCNGVLYIGELHPYRQYAGTAARFETAEGTEKIKGYRHHLSDYIGAAKIAGFKFINLSESFDKKHENDMPRILSLLFQKE